MTRRQTLRLTNKEKRAIIILCLVEGWKKADLARLFEVSNSRVSQIVNDYYNEHGKIGLKFNVKNQ